MRPVIGADPRSARRTGSTGWASCTYAHSARAGIGGRCPHRYSSPTRSTRYAAPIAGPHRSQVSFISGRLPVFRRAQVPRPAAPYGLLATHICYPARPHRGHRAPPPGPELVRAAPAVVVVPQRTAYGRAVPRTMVVI